MKKIMTFIIAAATAFFAVVFPSIEGICAGEPQVSALAAVLISADTGEIVYSVNCDKKLPMASTTKIMTTLLCLESGDLDEEFTVDSEAIKVEGSSMGLQENDIVTKYALCCGMLLPSGNDAANAAAVKIAGSIEAFADMMNERAAEIGMTRTHFVTPSGLEGEGHGSSAYDMALLAREALKNETFLEICSSKSIKLSFGNPPYERWLSNTNKLLDMYDGVYGVKTGFTDEAGRCLVSACERNGIRLICVTLNDKNDWNDHMAMYDYGFSVMHSISPEIPECIELSVVGADCETVSVAAAGEPVKIATAEEGLSEFAYELVAPPFVYAPIAVGDELAQLRVTYKNREVCRIPLYAQEECSAPVHEKKTESGKNPFKKALDKLRSFFS